MIGLTDGAWKVANLDNRIKILLTLSLIIAGAFWMEAAPDTAPAVSNIGSAEYPKIDSELHQHGLAADHTGGRARLALNQADLAKNAARQQVRQQSAAPTSPPRRARQS